MAEGRASELAQSRQETVVPVKASAVDMPEPVPLAEAGKLVVEEVDSLAVGEAGSSAVGVVGSLAVEEVGKPAAAGPPAGVELAKAVSHNFHKNPHRQGLDAGKPDRSHRLGQPVEPTEPRAALREAQQQRRAGRSHNYHRRSRLPGQGCCNSDMLC